MNIYCYYWEYTLLDRGTLPDYFNETYLKLCEWHPFDEFTKLSLNDFLKKPTKEFVGHCDHLIRLFIIKKPKYFVPQKYCTDEHIYDLKHAILVYVVYG